MSNAQLLGKGVSDDKVYSQTRRRTQDSRIYISLYIATENPGIANPKSVEFHLISQFVYTKMHLNE